MTNIYTSILLCLCLAACTGFKEKLGLTRTVPNEFETIKQDPLVIPTTLSVLPPEQMKGRKKQSASDKAKKILGIQDTSSTRMQHKAENDLLKRAKANTRDPNIRHKLKPEKTEDTLHDKIQKTLVFWKKPQKKGNVIDPTKETVALKRNKK